MLINLASRFHNISCLHVLYFVNILKAFADNKINETKQLKFDMEVVENIVGKGEKAGNQPFLRSLIFFKRLLS